MKQEGFFTRILALLLSLSLALPPQALALRLSQEEATPRAPALRPTEIKQQKAGLESLEEAMGVPASEPASVEEVPPPAQSAAGLEESAEIRAFKLEKDFLEGKRPKRHRIDWIEGLLRDYHREMLGGLEPELFQELLERGRRFYSEDPEEFWHLTFHALRTVEKGSRDQARYTFQRALKRQGSRLPLWTDLRIFSLMKLVEEANSNKGAKIDLKQASLYTHEENRKGPNLDLLVHLNRAYSQVGKRKVPGIDSWQDALAQYSSFAKGLAGGNASPPAAGLEEGIARVDTPRDWTGQKLEVLRRWAQGGRQTVTVQLNPFATEPHEIEEYLWSATNSGVVSKVTLVGAHIVEGDPAGSYLLVRGENLPNPSSDTRLFLSWVQEVSLDLPRLGLSAAAASAAGLEGDRPNVKNLKKAIGWGLVTASLLGLATWGWLALRQQAVAPEKPQPEPSVTRPPNGFDPKQIRPYREFQEEVGYPIPTKSEFQAMLQKFVDELHGTGFQEFSRQDFDHGHLVYSVSLSGYRRKGPTEPGEVKLIALLYHTYESLGNLELVKDKRSWIQRYRPDEVQSPELASRYVGERSSIEGIKMGPSLSFIEDMNLFDQFGTVLFSILNPDHFGLDKEMGLFGRVGINFISVDPSQLPPSLQETDNVVQVTLPNGRTVHLVVSYTKAGLETEEVHQRVTQLLQSSGIRNGKWKALVLRLLKNDKVTLNALINAPAATVNAKWDEWTAIRELKLKPGDRMNLIQDVSRAVKQTTRQVTPSGTGGEEKEAEARQLTHQQAQALTGWSAQVEEVLRQYLAQPDRGAMILRLQGHFKSGDAHGALRFIDEVIDQGVPADRILVVTEQGAPDDSDLGAAVSSTSIEDLTILQKLSFVLDRALLERIRRYYLEGGQPPLPVSQIISNAEYEKAFWKIFQEANAAMPKIHRLIRQTPINHPNFALALSSGLASRNKGRGIKQEWEHPPASSWLLDRLHKSADAEGRDQLFFEGNSEEALWWFWNSFDLKEWNSHERDMVLAQRLQSFLSQPEYQGHLIIVVRGADHEELDTLLGDYGGIPHAVSLYRSQDPFSEFSSKRRKEGRVGQPLLPEQRSLLLKYGIFTRLYNLLDRFGQVPNAFVRHDALRTTLENVSDADARAINHTVYQVSLQNRWIPPQLVSQLEAHVVFAWLNDHRKVSETFLAFVPQFKEMRLSNWLSFFQKVLSAGLEGGILRVDTPVQWTKEKLDVLSNWAQGGRQTVAIQLDPFATIPREIEEYLWQATNAGVVAKVTLKDAHLVEGDPDHSYLFIRVDNLPNPFSDTRLYLSWVQEVSLDLPSSGLVPSAVAAAGLEGQFGLDEKEFAGLKFLLKVEADVFPYDLQGTIRRLNEIGGNASGEERRLAYRLLRKLRQQERNEEEREMVTKKRVITSAGQPTESSRVSTHRAAWLTFILATFFVGGASLWHIWRSGTTVPEIPAKQDAEERKEAPPERLTPALTELPPPFNWGAHRLEWPLVTSPELDERYRAGVLPGPVQQVVDGRFMMGITKILVTGKVISPDKEPQEISVNAIFGSVYRNAEDGTYAIQISHPDGIGLDVGPFRHLATDFWLMTLPENFKDVRMETPQVAVFREALSAGPVKFVGQTAQIGENAISLADLKEFSKTLTLEESLFKLFKSDKETTVIPLGSADQLSGKVRIFDQVGVPFAEGLPQVTHVPLAKSKGMAIFTFQREPKLTDRDIVFFDGETVSHFRVEDWLPPGIHPKVVVTDSAQFTGRQLPQILAILEEILKKPEKTLYLTIKEYKGRQLLIISA